MKHLICKNEEQVSLKYDILIVILGIGGFISAADNWFVSPILPAIASEFNTSIPRTGIILTLYMIPYGIMQPVYGYFSDCYSKVRILKLIICGFALGTCGCAFARSLFVLSVWRTVTGFFAAGIIAVSLALIGDTVPVSKQSKYVGKFMGIVFLGQGFSAGLGGTLARYVSWRVLFIFFVAAAICTVFLLFTIPKGNIVHVNKKFFTEVKCVTLTPSGKIIFPMAFIAGFLFLGLYSYLGAYFHYALKLNYMECGIIVMFYGFACLGAGSIMGKLNVKIGYKNVIILGEIFALMTTLFLINFHCWEMGLVATISLGIGYIFVQSTLATMAFDVASDSKGLPSGLIGFGLFCGGGLGSAFSGFVIAKISYQLLWIIFFIFISIFIFVTYKQINNE
ncbi:MFS transporter [Clostridium ljungdahlii]|uniref:MFS transporter n=1 Tax=Clostridium ljungdahlii TaxID=1538 RepID=UPI00386B99A2